MTPPCRSHRLGRRVRRRPLHGQADGAWAGGGADPRGHRPRWRRSAVATERVRLGTLVLGNTYRHPAVLANWVATVDHISGGRLLLGVGAGWQENEHEQYGIDLPPPGERLDRFEEACQVLHGLLREETDDRSTAPTTRSPTRCEPKPVQDPLPLLIGGKGDRMLGVVARYADEWNIWGRPTPSPSAPRCSTSAARHRPRPGRDRRSTQALFLVTDDAAKASASGRNRLAPPSPARRPDRRGGGRVGGRRRRRGHRPRLHPRQGAEPPRPPRPHHRAGRPSSTHSRSGVAGQLRVVRQRQIWSVGRLGCGRGDADGGGEDGQRRARRAWPRRRRLSNGSRWVAW